MPIFKYIITHMFFSFHMQSNTAASILCLRTYTHTHYLIFFIAFFFLVCFFVVRKKKKNTLKYKYIFYDTHKFLFYFIFNSTKQHLTRISFPISLALECGKMSFWVNFSSFHAFTHPSPFNSCVCVFYFAVIFARS